MKQKIFISFDLLDTNTSPKLITKQLNIKPYRELLKGEKNNKLIIPRQNIWSIVSNSKSLKIKDHWDEIEKKINNVKNELKILTKEGKSYLSIVITTDEGLKNKKIPPKMIQFAKDINAILEIDHLQNNLDIKKFIKENNGFIDKDGWINF